MSRRPSLPQIYWQAIRPRTLPASAAPVAVGTALAIRDGSFSLLPALLALCGSLTLQVLVNLHNDVADFRRGADGADRLGPLRAAQQGLLSEAALERAIALVALLGAAIGGALFLLAGWPVLVIGACSAVAAFAYTGGPRPLAYVGGAEALVILFFGVVAVGGTVFVQGGAVGPVALLLGLAIGCAATSLLAVNNLRDRRSDRRANKLTLAVRFGERFARAEYALCWALALGTALCATAFGVRGLWCVLALAPLAVRRTQAVFRRDGAELNRELAAASALLVGFAALLCVGVLL